MAWRTDEFQRSLTGVSPNTLQAYGSDVAAFVEWAERAHIEGPEAVDRLVLRRYLAYLTTRQYARRTISRKAAAVRRYFAWLHRTGAVPIDPAAGLSAPAGERRLPHVLRRAEVDDLLDGSM